MGSPDQRPDRRPDRADWGEIATVRISTFGDPWDYADGNLSSTYVSST